MTSSMIAHTSDSVSKCQIKLHSSASHSETDKLDVLIHAIKSRNAYPLRGEYRIGGHR
jgi:hypothetical protein